MPKIRLTMTLEWGYDEEEGPILDQKMPANLESVPEEKPLGFAP